MRTVAVYLLCIYVMLSQTATSQSIYFEETFDSFGGFTDHSNGAIQVAGGYVFIYSGIKYTSSPRESSVCFTRFNEDASVISTDTCYSADSTTFYHTWLIGSDNNSYSIAGYLIKPNHQTTGMGIYTFGLDGAKTNAIEYFNDTMTYYPTEFLALDTTFVVCGQSRHSNNYDFSLTKITKSGIVVFEKCYGGNADEAAQSLILTPDGGFLLLGWTSSFGAGERDFFLIKTDSLGNQQWQKTYGGSDFDSGWGISSLSDGNYILSGLTGNSGKLYKIDADGVTIWQHSYSYNGDLTELYWTKELQNGSLVTVGLGDNSTDGNYGYLQKTDSEGNLLWQQKYNYNENTDLFYNVLPTADDGFLLSGQCANNVTGQDAWLLKVDSLGCPYPNCTVGIAEETKMVALNIWPNPATEVLNVEVFNAKETTVNIKDVLGKEVYHSIFTEAKIAVDISQFKKGMYVVEVGMGNTSIIKKLIVQ